MAQISEPLAAADIPAYYISTFKFDHALVSVTPAGQGQLGAGQGRGSSCSGHQLLLLVHRSRKRISVVSLVP